MNDHSNGVMAALLPTTAEWCHIAIPHLTIVYAGKTDEVNPTVQNDLAKEALSISRLFGPICLDVLRPDIFPDNDSEPKVDVLRLMPSPELLVMRRAMERWNVSEHTDYTPHVTVGPVGSLSGEIPSRIDFDRIAVYWGEAAYIFRFGRKLSMASPANSY